MQVTTVRTVLFGVNAVVYSRAEGFPTDFVLVEVQQSDVDVARNILEGMKGVRRVIEDQSLVGRKLLAPILLTENQDRFKRTSLNTLFNLSGLRASG